MLNGDDPGRPGKEQVLGIPWWHPACGAHYVGALGQSPWCSAKITGSWTKTKKCSFMPEQTQHLGHTASQSRVFVGLRKIAALSVSQISRFEFPRSFLGLASYYQQFVSEHSRIAGPLYVLTRKDAPFVWTDVIKKAFETVKELLTEASTLVFPDFSKWKDFHSLTDASGEGLGAVLAQKQEHGLEKLIAFASQAVQQHECNYGVTEMEALGVVWAMK